MRLDAQIRVRFNLMPIKRKSQRQDIKEQVHHTNVKKEHVNIAD